ncbi:Uncharacterised protein [Mycobacteroides abscessus]|nr:Uncharacterised protein [Mycobacteroides abscessus]
MLDAAIARHAWRLKDVDAPTIDELRLLLPVDLVDGEGAPALLATLEPPAPEDAPAEPPATGGTDGTDGTDDAPDTAPSSAEENA